MSFNKLIVDLPTTDKLDRALRRLESKADSSLSMDIQSLPEIVDTTLTALAANTLPNRKTTKLVALSGLTEIYNQPDGIHFVQKFLDLVVKESSAVYAKCLVIGYLRITGSNEWLPNAVRKAALKVIDRLPGMWSRRVSEYHLLEEQPGQYLASQILTSSINPRDVMNDAGLRGVLGGTGYAREVFNQICNVVSQGHSEELLERFWLFTNADNQPIFSESLANYSRALLSPYIESEADDLTRQKIQRFLTETFKDPRMNQVSWSSLPEEELSVIYRWLTKHSFDILLKVVEQSNDTQQWAERREFWGKYIDAGHVTEAWAALGPAAASIARRMVQEGVLGSTREYAVLETGVDRWHSVIMMRMGDYVVTEWTHSGKVRFYHSKENESTPLFYKQRYSVDSYGKGLRNDRAPDFFKAHLGNWKFDVRRFISTKMGIRADSFHASLKKSQTSDPNQRCHICGTGGHLMKSWIPDKLICNTCLQAQTTTR